MLPSLKTPFKRSITATLTGLGMVAILATGCKTTSPKASGAASINSGEIEKPPLHIELIGRYTSGQYGEGAAEVVAYHENSKRLFVVNGAAKSIDIIPLTLMQNKALPLPYTGSNLSGSRLQLPKSAQTAEGSLPIKSPNSVYIYRDLMAVAMQNKNKQAAGAVLFYDISTQPKLIKSVKVGSLPDMVAINKDGTLAITANEGEPSKDFKTDPEGSISLIDLRNGIAPKATTLNFNQFDNRRAALEATGVKFASPEGTSVSQDLEPEYVAISQDNKKAFVTLQENNALAIVDLENKVITDVVGLGFKDWSKYKIDVSNKDGAQLNTYENLFGLYQPDTIASFTTNGKGYLITANEGDAREYIYQASETDCKAAGHKYDEEDGCISYTEEYRAKKLSFKSPSVIDSYYDKNGIGRLKVTHVLGDKDKDGYHEELYAYGARSFSIWDEQGNQVFDSGDEFARILLDKYGDDFNNNESKNSGDNRSDDKGSEPEAVTTGKIGDKTYAFIGLERQGGIFVYDISRPKYSKYVTYVNNRDFSVNYEIDDDTSPVTLKGDYKKAGDLAPEGLVFIAAKHSPTGTPLLAVANEVSGTVSVYRIKE